MTVSSVEVDGGDDVGAGLGLEDRVLLREVQRRHGDDHAGEEGSALLVVVRHGRVVPGSRRADAVLGALELGLQGDEVLAGLEVRVVLGDDQQLAERTGELVLGRQEGFELLGADIVHVDVGLSDRRTRGGDFGEDLLFVAGVALDRGDQVGNQVGSALVLGVDVAQFLVHVLVEVDEGVVGAGHRDDGQEKGGQQAADDPVGRLHGKEPPCRQFIRQREILPEKVVFVNGLEKEKH